MIDFSALPRSGGIATSLALVRSWPWHLALACLGTAISGLLSLLPYLVAWLLLAQMLGSSASAQWFAWLIPALVAGWALRHALACMSKIIAHRLAFTAIAQLKQCLFDKLERVRLSHFDQAPAVQQSQLIGQQADELEDAVAHLLPELTAATLVPAALACLLLGLDWRMGIACLLPYFLAIACSLYSMSVGKVAGQRMMQAWGALVQNLHTLLQHQLLLRTYNQADTAQRRIDNALEIFEAQSTAAVRQPLGLAVLFMVLGTSPLSSVLLVGGALYARDALSLPTLAFFCIVSVGLGTLYSDVFSFFLRLGKLKAIWKRVFGLLDGDEPAWGTLGLVKTPSGIELRQVCKQHGERSILTDITLTVNPGQSLALVGHSGAGKTTLARLLLRFDDPDSGKILLGGLPLAAYTETALRQAVVFVSQQTELFAVSVADNIRLGRPNTDLAAVEAVARLTLCHEFISALPQGYETVLAPDGRDLSGGQRQRLALARALMLDAPVLVLDEALAFSDIENEVKIQQAITRLARGRTLIVIAHRLPTVRTLDTIAVMAQGHIVEKGRHENLIEAGGTYAMLWRQIEQAPRNLEPSP
ncbi:ABC transporter ATP-binding protein [Cupriavidus basilensis]|nr:ABC transporter ATP-binding protein [Cupriavidus basilensis]